MSMAISTFPVGLEWFGGELVGPGDAAYDHVRQVHNGLIDKRPSLVARCLTTPDVVDAVRYAAERRVGDRRTGRWAQRGGECRH